MMISNIENVNIDVGSLEFRDFRINNPLKIVRQSWSIPKKPINDRAKEDFNQFSCLETPDIQWLRNLF